MRPPTDRPDVSSSSSSVDAAALRAIATAAARIGGRIVASADRPADVDEKAAGDYVTDVDHRSEDAIRSFLEAETPEIPVLGEESGGGTGDLYWAVDPLDGTRNFVLGFPVVGVAVAAVHGRTPVAGAIEAPLLGQAFSAAAGAGAWSGDGRLRVSARPVAEAVVATGFPFRRKELLDRHLATLRTVLERTEDARRAGAASLDLAWTAAGVFDGFFELGLHVWDVAAGAILVSEAGGVVTDWDGGDGYLGGDILAGSGPMHAELLAIIRATPAS